MNYYSNTGELDVSDKLPTEAYNKGYRLTWYRPVETDPTILYREGDEVYRWNCDPSMGEVWDKIRELEHEATV